MDELTTFDDFHHELYGYAPFPWQSRLAKECLDEGSWPSEIGVPTGLGKSTCLDIAVWLLAAAATLPPEDRQMPTRCWWVVNRRLLVDVATTRAEQLQANLKDALETGQGQISVVARRLASLSLSGEPLEVVRLRGGAEIGRPSDPAQSAIILSTIPMYGSRLLFRGYGSSRSMRPIDAALAGTDSLVLMDEAHLAPHLTALFKPLQFCDRAPEHPLPESRRYPVAVSLTATGEASPEARFDLKDEDYANDIVCSRIDAAKPIQVVEHARHRARAKVLAELALDRLSPDQGRQTGVVFVNSPKTAREVLNHLQKLTAKSPIDDLQIEMLTGRMREHEADVIRERLSLRLASGRERQPDDKPVIVVATQTLEVGADYDFDVLVTEACGVRALTQRLGRLNRLGNNHEALGAYLHTDAGRDGYSIYGEEPKQVITRLREAMDADEVVRLHPRVVAEVLGEPEDFVQPAPVITPEILREWTKTSTPPFNEAPVEPYFSGLQDDSLRVTVIWRAFISDDPATEPIFWPRVRPEETIDIPLTEARELLDEEFAHRLDPERTGLEKIEKRDLRPGNTLVLPIEHGGYDQFGFAPNSRDHVFDVSIAQHGLPLNFNGLKHLLADPGKRTVKKFDQTLQGYLKDILQPADDDTRSDSERIAPLIDWFLNMVPPPPTFPDGAWVSLLDNLEPTVIRPAGAMPRLEIKKNQPANKPASGKVVADKEVLADELDELSVVDPGVDESALKLVAHGDAVGDLAAEISRRVGVDPDRVGDIQRSGTFHDVGKADDRFQRWLHPEATPDSELVAKSVTSRSQWRADRIAAGWPSGGRHEELSRRAVKAWAGERPEADLIQHLVVTHHGHGRPLVVPVADGAVGAFKVEVGDLSVAIDQSLAVPDFSQPERFARLSQRFGHWGLALLEAIVRQADHAVSAGSAQKEIQ